MTSLQVRANIIGCERCELRERCRRPVPWDGPVPHRMAVVGEAPGRTEDEQGRPFVGVSGRLARSWVEPRFGVVPWMNAVSCWPNRTPTKNEVVACRENLLEQLRLVEPEFVLFFGGVSYSGWLDFRVGEIRGRWFRVAVPGLEPEPWGLVTWHPAAVLRNRSLEVDVLDDLRVFRESMVDDGIPPYVYRPCIKCGSCVGTMISREGIAWCSKHWDWKGKKTTKTSKSTTNSFSGM